MLPGRIDGLHIHDNFGHGDDHMIPGIGIIEWDEVLDALAAIQYSGDFTLGSWRFMGCYGLELLNDTIRINYIAGRRLADQLERKIENS